MDYYTHQPIPRFRNIGFRFNTLNFHQKVIIFKNNRNEFLTRGGLPATSNGFLNAGIHELYAFASVFSLPGVALPAYAETTEDERLLLTLNYEWGTFRFELFAYLVNPTNNWYEVGLTAVKNSQGFRFRRHRLIDLFTDNPIFQIEEEWGIGLKLTSDSSGKRINDDLDSITIVGGVQQEMQLIQPHPPAIVNNLYGGSGSNTPTQTYTPVIVLTLPNGEGSTHTLANTQIKIAISGLEPNKSFTYAWFKDGSEIPVSENQLSGADGKFEKTVGAYLLQQYGSGNYRVKVGTQESNVLAVTTASVTVASNSFEINNTATFTVTVKGLPNNQAYTISWVKEGVLVANSGISKNFTPDSNGNHTTSFATSLFAGTGYGEANYKARITIGNNYIESANFTPITPPNITLSPGTAYILENTQMLGAIRKFQPSSALSWILYRFLDGGAGIEISSSGNVSTNSNGSADVTLDSSHLTKGGGNYFLYGVQGNLNVASNQISVVQTTITFNKTTVNYAAGTTSVLTVNGLLPSSAFNISVERFVNNAWTDVANSSVARTFNSNGTATSYSIADSFFNNYPDGTYRWKITKNGYTVTSSQFTVAYVAPGGAPALS